MLQFLQPMLSLLPKRKWVCNSATDFCNVCCTKIKSGLLSSNKHHCRYCGNIVCHQCSATTLKKHRICDSCAQLIRQQQSNRNPFNNTDCDSDSEEKEELSPYNTPMLKYKECSVDTIDEMDIIDNEYTCLDIALPPTTSSISMSSFNIFTMENTHSLYNSNHFAKKQQIKSYLVHGFVRKCWKISLQFNCCKLMSEYPCDDIMHLLVELLSISDSFDEYHTNLNIIISNKPLYHLKSYRNVQYVERTKEWNMECYHSFGNDVIRRGAKKVWKFKICGERNNAQKPCILIGIVEDDKVKNFVDEYCGSFNDEWNDGYALYTADWNIYHKDAKGIRFTSDFVGIDITPNDLISVEVDLTQKYPANISNSSKSTMTLTEYSNNSRCGTLRYLFNGKSNVFQNDGIAFDNIDINKSYRLAVGMYLRDKLAMFQIV